MDSVDDFQFTPLTEGLGFNNQAPQSRPSSAHTEAKTQSRQSRQARERNQEQTRERIERRQLEEASAHDLDMQEDSKIISDLIASLPPSLDFLSEPESAAAKKTLSGALGGALSGAVTRSERRLPALPDIEPNLSLPDGDRPQIFQPFAREDFNATSSTALAPKNISTGALAAPLTSALGSKRDLDGLKMPKPGSKAVATGASASGAVESGAGVLKVPSAYRERLNESFARAFPHAERKVETERVTTRSSARELATRKAMAVEITGLVPVPGHLGAGFLDAMVVTGLSALLLVAIVAITHVNLYGLLTNMRTDGPTQVHVALLFLACLQLYLLTARSFFRASLGEWAFDLQLGSNDDQIKAVYPLLVAWRTIVITVTGLVVIPVLSLIFRRDIGRYLTGLQLYFQKN